MNASILHRVKLTLAAIILTMFFVKVVKADEQTYQHVLRGTVLVVNKDGLGSGVLVDSNRKLVVTAGHVVGTSDDVTVCFPDFQPNGRPNTARSHYLNGLETLGIHAHVLKRDPSRDVAVVQLDRIPAGAQEIPMATTPVMPGQTVYAIGNSGGDDDDFMWCYRDGAVRQACHKHLGGGGRVIDADMIETTIASNHGDSGGPVVNARGELIAITVSHHGNTAQEDIGQNVGYCTEVSEIRAVLADLSTSVTSPLALPAPKPLSLTQLLASTNEAVTFNGLNAQLNGTPELPMLNTVDVNVRMEITGLAHHHCDLLVTLTDSSGNVVRDPSGQIVQSSVSLTPAFEDTTYYNDPAKHLSVQFMQAQIHSALQGQTQYSFLLSLRDTDTGKWITSGPTKVDFNEASN